MLAFKNPWMPYTYESKVMGAVGCRKVFRLSYCWLVNYRSRLSKKWVANLLSHLFPPTSFKCSWEVVVQEYWRQHIQESTKQIKALLSLQVNPLERKGMSVTANLIEQQEE